MDEKKNYVVDKTKLESKDDVIVLFMNLQEQTNILLEEVINDNRILKQEVSNLRNLVIRYETVQKEIDEIIFERRECQREVKLKLAESNLNLEGIKERISANKDIVDGKFDTKISGIYEHFNKELRDISSSITKECKDMTSTISTMKIDAAKQGAKYGVIVSIATFIIMTLIGLFLHWVEKKIISP